MADFSSSRSERQFWITRGQLAALGVTTLSVAMLALFVCLMLGRRGAPEASPEAVGGALVGTDVENDALTELLSRVEQAAASTVPEAMAEPAGDLSYPERLVGEDFVLGLPDEAPTVDGPTTVVDPPPAGSLALPDEPAREVPESGFAVQVFSFDDPNVADEKVAELKAMDLSAYRVDALVGGQTWHRVRIGPYPSQSAAAAAEPGLSETLGISDARVTGVR